MTAHGRDRKKTRQATRPTETSGNKKNRSTTMTLSPKNSTARQDLLTMLFAIPLSLLGTGFLFALVSAAGHVGA